MSSTMYYVVPPVRLHGIIHAIYIWVCDPIWCSCSVYARAFREGFTVTLVSGRTVGIGAYLARLGRRSVLVMPAYNLYACHSMAAVPCGVRIMLLCPCPQPAWSLLLVLPSMYTYRPYALFSACPPCLYACLFVCVCVCAQPTMHAVSWNTLNQCHFRVTAGTSTTGNTCVNRTEGGKCSTVFKVTEDLLCCS